MTLLQLTYFQAVCKLGSTTKAAAALSVSQPTISVSIRDLEQEFSVSLFTRNKNRLEVTPEGRVLLELSEDLLRKADEISSVMQDLSGKRKRIRVGISPMLCSVLLSRLLKDFKVNYPDTDIQVVEDGRVPLFLKLENDEVDMILMSEEGDESIPIKARCRKLPVTELEYCCCVSPEHRLANYERAGAKEIGSDPLVTFTSGYHQESFVNRFFSEKGLVPNIAFRSDQLSTIYELVAKNQYISFMYGCLSQQRQDLRFLPVDPPLQVKISLFWKQSGVFYSDMNRLIQSIRRICP